MLFTAQGECVQAGRNHKEHHNAMVEFGVDYKAAHCRQGNNQHGRKQTMDDTQDGDCNSRFIGLYGMSKSGHNEKLGE